MRNLLTLEREFGPLREDMDEMLVLRPDGTPSARMRASSPREAILRTAAARITEDEFAELCLGFPRAGYLPDYLARSEVASVQRQDPRSYRQKRPDR
ncbi:hypothetical protein LAZ40_06755 [Cereibacter sphaeroides]|uniref:hypothetical protein n=1 Tax=Cereibacter sphaeroides TaxID=1063 RepID=UPI001F16A676|nr:hypothetical protein [Cereibacter sphaeroides]MCE6958746.1 hypothetical protein [Cereibacter sphaeroides]MCE6973380.1 hypothetical protein [Cereibacter sphaeroides]